jgi:type IV pilus assembly protein PilA
LKVFGPVFSLSKFVFLALDSHFYYCHNSMALRPRATVRGFTLIELMMVVSIIGILASIALPTYRQYTIRARVTEGLAVASAAKTAVAVSVAARSGQAIAAYAGVGPAATGSYGFTLSGPTQQVASVAISATAAVPGLHTDGVVTIAYRPAIGVPGLRLNLIPGSGVVANGLPAGPMVMNSPIAWGCRTVPAGTTAFFAMIPSNCRN